MFKIFSYKIYTNHELIHHSLDALILASDFIPGARIPAIRLFDPHSQYCNIPTQAIDSS